MSDHVGHCRSTFDKPQLTLMKEVGPSNKALRREVYPLQDHDNLEALNKH